MIGLSNQKVSLFRGCRCLEGVVVEREGDLALHYVYFKQNNGGSLGHNLYKINCSSKRIGNFTAPKNIE